MLIAAAPGALLPSGLTSWVITDGKVGDEVHCFGIAAALGLTPHRRLVRPRAPWSWMAPYGPVDWRDAPHRPGSPITKPFPDIAIASGRRTVPYLLALKQASGGRTFTVFSKDPYRGRGAADVITVPAHDALRGDNVIATLTSPHRLTEAGFASARATPDARLATLPEPRIAMILGGPSGRIDITAADADTLAGIATQMVTEGHGLMLTPSRRTPDFVMEKLRAALSDAMRAGRAFLWDGSGANPYGAILALADAIVITGDSVNMIGEAAMSGAPIHVVEATGHHPKVTRFIDGMVAAGAARRWTGRLERFSYEPIDATPTIARGIAERFHAFQAKRSAAA
ncbi:mitochondrial fission ELM1 family protein [Lichenihabitans sp. Uapishka_5]|uniref:mitochondrial fission ELM1 family protein n=1 Tax=Lichenihabitans sp. Uapishka_5 TaxID=3037302 RepID=UPI0029E80B71|nr:mitochondrial fission ELM1 family protein [Lichenihabitans sp. Uapishka_5]MDX7951960.1 mitochondrial fission ELM1 family protein [Lichenihabitans sp. Uapishka_5]